jgi:lysyl-tRNA synthetase class I
MAGAANGYAAIKVRYSNRATAAASCDAPAFPTEKIIMSMQHRLTDQVVRADPWMLFCTVCSDKMRITMAAPAKHGRETRTYECACGHSERINLAIQ